MKMPRISLFNKSTNSNNEQKDIIVHKRRKVSLFKRRKKPEIRHLTHERSKKEYKKIILYIFVALLILVALSGFLYGIRIFVIEQILVKNDVIINPQTQTILSNMQVEEILNSAGFPVSDITIASESGIVSFIMNDKTKIYISSKKDIYEQLDLIEAIDRQIKQDGKQVNLIDLRYNKPIVKIQ